MHCAVYPRKRSDSGSALLVTIIVVAILGIGIGSYLRLVGAQNRSVMRSLAWNQSVSALEAGIEEALTQIHQNGIANLSANGWSSSGGWYQRIRTLSDGTAYIVRIQPVNPPVIVSTGVVPDPLYGASVGSTAEQVLAAAQNPSAYLRRTVRVTTHMDGMFAKGMVAKGQIDLKGNNIATDSFDFTATGPYSVAGRRANGDVATDSGLVNSLSVGNANIIGHVSTGPGGSVSIGPNGTVGDIAWVTSGRKGIQPGHSSDDMNVEFPSVVVPFSSGTIPVAGTVGGTNYDIVIGGGDYIKSSVSGKVIVTGNARLYVDSSFSLSGQGFIYIAPGASLTVYCAAPSVSLGGNGIANPSGDAIKFMLYGMDTCTSISYNGNAAFSGVIYAPNADFSLGGGGNNTYDFVGASITKTVTMNGHFNFHYDESLLTRGPSRGYIPVSWNEVDPGFGLPTGT